MLILFAFHCFVFKLILVGLVWICADVVYIRVVDSGRVMGL